MNLNFSNNVKFFRPRVALKYIGGVLAVLGIPIFILTGVLFFALPLVGAGVLCIAINRELNTRESEIRFEIRRVTDDMEKELENRYYDPMRPYPRMLVSTLGDYVYGEKGILLRPMKLGKPISSTYHAASFGFKNGKLHILERRFSLIRDELVEHSYRFDFRDLERFELCELEKTGICFSELSLYGADGRVVLKMPVPLDFSVQKFVSDTNDIFDRHRADAVK